MKDLILKFGEDISSNTYTCSNMPDCESNRVDLQVIKKFMEEIENTKILREIIFSKQPCELKKIYYAKFDEIQRSDEIIMGGVLVKEADWMPSNFMMMSFANKNHNEVHLYKDGKLYKSNSEQLLNVFNGMKENKFSL